MAAHIPLTVPNQERVVPALLAALGYRGQARWISVYWNGREAALSDGLGNGTGFFDGYWAFVLHQAIAGQTIGYVTRDGSIAARARLLIDQQSGTVLLAPLSTYRISSDPVIGQWMGNDAPELDAARFEGSAPVMPGEDLEATIIRPQQQRVASLRTALDGEIT